MVEESAVDQKINNNDNLTNISDKPGKHSTASQTNLLGSQAQLDATNEPGTSVMDRLDNLQLTDVELTATAESKEGTTGSSTLSDKFMHDKIQGDDETGSQSYLNFNTAEANQSSTRDRYDILFVIMSYFEFSCLHN